MAITVLESSRISAHRAINRPRQTLLLLSDGNTNNAIVLQNNNIANCTKDWRFTDATSTAIELRPTSCDAIESSAQSLTLVMGCSLNEVID